MAVKLKILYLENNPVDVKLVRLELKKARFEYTMRVVENRNDYENEIEQYKPDLVLADYNLHGYDGISAMKYCITKDPDLPFIMVTGSLDEESAVGVMKMGAWDYVLKENLHRLEPGIKNALKLKEEKLIRKAAFEELRRNEEKYRNLFEHAEAGMFRSKDNGSSFLAVNRKFADILGYSLKAINGMKTSEIWWRKEEQDGLLHVLKEKGVVEDFEVRMRAKDGRMIRALLSARFYPEEKVIEGSLMDITQRRREELTRDVMYNISETAHSSSSLKELLITINFELTRVIRTRNFFIGLISQDKKYLSIPLMRDEKDHFDEVPLKNSISNLLVREKKTLKFNRSGLEKRIKKEKIKVTGTMPEIWVGVPLKVNREVMGVMVIQDYEDAKAFNKEDIKLLKYVSTQVAQAIHRKQSSDEIRKLQQGMEQSPVSIVITGVEGNIEYVNPKLLEITQYTREELIHQNPRLFQSGLTPAKTYKTLWDTVTHGKTWKGEFLNRKKNGELYVESATISPILDEEGEIKYYIGVKEDISDLKRMQEALIESERKFKSIAEKAQDGIVIMDGEFHVTYWNPAFEGMTGYSRKELQSGLANSIIENAVVSFGIDSQTMQSFNKTGKLELTEKAFDLSLRSKNGKEVPLNVLFSTIFLENRWYIVAIIRDVSERVKYEEELKNAKERAEEANRLKTAFLATMSHELNTPLNSIIGFSDLIRLSNNPADIEDYAQNISRSGYQLLGILQNILHSSLMESGNLKLKKTFFDLKSLVSRLLELHDEIAARYEKDGLEFHLKKIPADLNVILNTDMGQLTHIVRNLLDNAYKFTEEGQVELVLSANGKNLMVEIKDTGIGIHKENRRIIFEPFRQGEESLTRKYGGTGLGLSLAKGLVELMGGSIQLKSEAGKGSVFSVTLPVVKEEKLKVKPELELKPEEMGIRLNNRKIMVVEDEEINYLLLKGILSRHGAQLVRAKNGKEGIQRYQENPDIDLVLMDIRMPVMNGLDATRALKKIKKDLPVIAVTAYTMPEDKTEAFKAGCDEFLTKPVKRDMLFSALSKNLK